MELNKKYFDQKFAELDKKFVIKKDLEKLATKADLKNFATKDDLKAQTQELREFAEEQTAELARIIATTVANPLEEHIQESDALNLNMRVTYLEHDMKQLKKSMQAR